MAFSLWEGAIAKICNGECDLKPVLQIYDVKLVNTAQNTSERYRMVLSDGVHLQQAMLTTQMNHVIKSGKLQKGSIIVMTEFLSNVIQNRKIIIVLALEVLVEKCDAIGDPKPYIESGTAALSASHGKVSTPQGSSTGQLGQSIGNQQHATSPASVSGFGQKVATRPPGMGENVNNIQAHGSSFVTAPTSLSNMANGMSGFAKVEHNAGHNPQHQNLSDCNQSSTGFMGGSRPSSNAYVRSAQQSFNQPSPVYVNRGPISKNEAPARIIPISALNPYQGRWTIKARVTSKGELRRYNNPRGEGKVFSFDLLDADGGEIRVTCFNSVADQFFDLVELGRVYLISKGTLKPVQRNFNHLNNEWEIFLEATSTVNPCIEEDGSIPRQRFDFRRISCIEGMENNSMVDVMGVVCSINPSSMIMRKNGTETSKRTLHLRDMSGRSVELTLWGNFCNLEGQQLQEMCDSGVFPVLAVKATRVSDFNGKTLGTISSSQLFINPDFEEANGLKEWFEKEGKNSSALSISREFASTGRTDIRKTVSQIKDEGLGRSDKPDWVTVKASVSFIRSENFCYTACPLLVGERQCNKKVNNNGDGTWHCERCDKSFPQCDYRYLLQLQIQDYTGITWVTAFQECGEEIMGIPAKDLYLMKYEEQDDSKFGEILRRVLFNQYLFKLKVKEEAVNDEQRVKLTLMRAELVNFSQESRFLLSSVEKLSTEEPMKFSVRGSIPNGPHGNVDFMQGPHGTVNNGDNVGNFERSLDAPSCQMGQYVSGPRPGSAGAFLTCSNCGSAGHTYQNCPRYMVKKNEQMFHGNYGSRLPYANTTADVSSASGKCFKCNQSGHWARDCPGQSGFQSTYGPSSAGPYGVSKMRGY